MIDHIPTKEEFRTFLTNQKIFAKGDIYVYEDKMISDVFVDPSKFLIQGACVLENCIRGMAMDTFWKGLKFDDSLKKVVVIDVPNSFIDCALTLSSYFEFQFFNTKFIPVKVECDKTGKFIIPEQYFSIFQDADAYIIVEGVVNNDLNIEKVSQLLNSLFKKEVMAILSLIDIRDNCNQIFDEENFYSFFSENIVKVHPYDTGKNLLNGVKRISKKHGKGAEWVNLFGQPPYEDEIDLSEFFEGPTNQDILNKIYRRNI